jgi:predicted phosphodiesterase
MRFVFDLISDLHVETWPNFDWSGQATSPCCIVAGDVARDRTILVETLTHLGQCYPGGVFYVDGNEEHKNYYEDLGESYSELQRQLTKIPNVVYMQDNVVIINGVAILGTNAWWTYDFDTAIDTDQSIEYVQHHFNISHLAASHINSVAYHDAAYMINSVRKLQTHSEVSAIVLVTHTVPAPWIVAHDTDLVDTWRFNGMGNSYISKAIDEDTEHKIKMWCFGHYHKPVDQQLGGVQYLCNPHGRGNTEWRQTVFYPRRIEIDV